MSTENLFKESNQEGSRADDALALMCQNIGLTLVNLPSLSECITVQVLGSKSIIIYILINPSAFPPSLDLESCLSVDK